MKWLILPPCLIAIIAFFTGNRADALIAAYLVAMLTCAGGIFGMPSRPAPDYRRLLEKGRIWISGAGILAGGISAAFVEFRMAVLMAVIAASFVGLCLLLRRMEPRPSALQAILWAVAITGTIGGLAWLNHNPNFDEYDQECGGSARYIEC